MCPGDQWSPGQRLFGSAYGISYTARQARRALQGQRKEPPVRKYQIYKRSGKIPKKTHRKGFLWYVSFPYFLPCSKKYGRRRHDQPKTFSKGCSAPMARRGGAMRASRPTRCGKSAASHEAPYIFGFAYENRNNAPELCGIALKNVHAADKILSQTRPKEGEFP